MGIHRLAVASSLGSPIFSTHARKEGEPGRRNHVKYVINNECGCFLHMNKPQMTCPRLPPTLATFIRLSFCREVPARPRCLSLDPKKKKNTCTEQNCVREKLRIFCGPSFFVNNKVSSKSDRDRSSAGRPATYSE